MKQAHELLFDLQNTKRASCISEYESWFKDIVEYLEAQINPKIIDPTIKTQLTLPLNFPEHTMLKVSDTGA